MKKLILLSLLFATGAKAQYSERWTNASTTSSGARIETMTDGICTKVNYNGTPSKNYGVAVGYVMAKYASDTSEHLRFVKTNSSGGVVNVKTGIRFKNNGTTASRWYNTRGYGICEKNDLNGTGGYFAVGSVGKNSYTGANATGGNSDALITFIDNNGIANYSKSIDFNSGDDVLTCVVPSNNDRNKFYTCGFSYHGTISNCIVAAFDTTGTLLWTRSYNFSTVIAPVQSTKAFGLCVVPGAGSTEDLVVCGNIVSSPVDSNGLVFRVSGTTKNVDWAKQQGFGSTTESYQKIVYTSSGQLAICGFSNFTGLHDVWITTMYTSGTLIKSKIILFSDPANPGSHIPSEAYDLRESGSLLYITGNTNTKSTNMALMFLKTSAMADPILAIPNYETQLIGDCYGIDLDPTGVSNAGVRLFSNNLGSPSTVYSSGFVMRTNMNGATCLAKDSIIPVADDLTTLLTEEILSAIPDTIKSVKQLTSKNKNCVSQTLCSGPTGALLKDEETSEAGLNDDDLPLTFQAYPNPFSGTVSINPGDDINDATIRIYNVLGKIVLEQNSVTFYRNQPVSLEVSSLVPGSYFVMILSGNKKYSSRIIKQH